MFDDDLFDMLNVLTLLVDLEPEQADLLEAICNGPLLTPDLLDAADALGGGEVDHTYKPTVPKTPSRDQPQLPGT